MSIKQRNLPSPEEIARIEREARTMRAQYIARGLVSFGRWIARPFTGGRVGHPAKA